MIYPKLSDGTIDWCVMCKHNGNDFYDLCCECEYPENSDDPPAKYEPKPMTNADRIRSMSDEELAKWLDLLVNRAKIYGENKVWLEDTPRYYTDWLDWLREEDDNG